MDPEDFSIKDEHTEEEAPLIPETEPEDNALIPEPDPEEGT